MKIATLVTSFLLILAGFFFLGAGPSHSTGCEFWENGVPTIVEDCSEIRVTGHSQGNHELDCTVILPWDVEGSPDPRYVPYPIIGWANGWDQGNVFGENCTEGYKQGLIEWALDGPYIVVAANQWSAQESDVLACVKMVIADYKDADGNNIGLAGHSQGGGAVIKAGDGEPNGIDIITVIAMNPYGPAWVNPEKQDGPLLLLGGTDDTTIPTSSFEEVLHAVEGGQGGLLAELAGGRHNSEAWGDYLDDDGLWKALHWTEALKTNFGEYQRVTELWWDIHLNDNARRERQLQRLFDRDPSWELW